MSQRSHAKPILIAAVFLALAFMAAGCSSSAADLTQAGNQAYSNQAYDDALKAYQAAAAKTPDLAEPHYNSANALYRQDKYAEAGKELEKALQYAKSDGVAQQISYNQGNVSFSAKQWDAAIEDYKQALLGNPADGDAKYNLELALQQKQDQQKQDQQKQDQQKQDQQKQDQQKQDQQKQDQQQQDQQQQDQQQQDQQKQDQQKQDQQQQDQQKQDQQQQDQQKQDQQQQDQQQQDQQQDQKNPAQQNQDPNQPAQSAQLASGQRMTPELAKQLLAAIARKSDNLQHRLGEYLSVPDGPPVQDW